MRNIFLGLLVCAPLLTPFSLSAAESTCRIKYNLSGWSFLYQRYTGTGVITCDNGQVANVSLSLHGAGLTAGIIDIKDAKGKFTGVNDIQELYGTHFTVGVNAGFARAGSARALFKGYIASGAAGKGGGYTLSGTFAGLTIK